MSQPRPQRTSVIAAILLALLLVGGYLGAYYALLQDDYQMEFVDRPTRVEPYYRGHCDAICVIFRPAHEIDRTLRPRRWEYQEPVLPPFAPPLPTTPQS